MFIKFCVWIFAMLGALVLAAAFLPASFAHQTLFVVAGVAFSGYLTTVSVAGLGLAAALARA